MEARAARILSGFQVLRSEVKASDTRVGSLATFFKTPKNNSATVFS